jgi:hypothetical protein
MLNLSQIQNLKKFRVCEEGWVEVGSSDANKKTSPYPLLGLFLADSLIYPSLSSISFNPFIIKTRDKTEMFLPVRLDNSFSNIVVLSSTLIDKVFFFFIDTDN